MSIFKRVYLLNNQTFFCFVCSYTFCDEGNVTVIPWTIAAQRGPALATLNNKIIVQEDSYFMVYGQVLYETTD